MKHCGIVCFLLCLCLLLGGCNGVTGDNSSRPDNSGSLESNGYNMQLIYDLTDSFNPFIATSKQNREICQLLYEPLVALDSNFSPALRIAESVSLSGKWCTVALKRVNFSDGTPLTADDVVYSLNIAAASENFGSQLKTVASAEANGDFKVNIHMTKADPYFTALLDFPIIKKNSDKEKSDDNIELPPVGCGRYILNNTQTALVANDGYYGEKTQVRSISLINAPDRESIDHYVSAGAVSMCYDDYSDNTVPRMSGLKKSVPLNNLVYLGINMQNPFLKDKHLRYAISSAINRTDIVADAYYGNGTVANGIFNPYWGAASGFQTLESVNNNQIAIENLKEIGYNSTDNEGYRISSSGKRLSFSLLINSDNQARVATAQLIKKQLTAVGIEAVIKAVPFEQYKALLTAKDFDLYIAEVKLLNNMDITQLVTPGGSMAFGIAGKSSSAQSSESVSSEESGSEQTPEADTPGSLNLTAAEAVKGLYEGKYTLGDVSSACLSEMPLIPLMYRSGVAMFTPALKTEPVCTVSDLFYNISNFTFKK